MTNNHLFREFLKRIGPKRKFIFDLDHTIWNCTLEYQQDTSVEFMKTKIKPDMHDILKNIQDNGNSLNVASRSSMPVECKAVLASAFPTIKFDHMAIYPSERFKRQDFRDCFQGSDRTVPHDFIMFDDDKLILNDLGTLYPSCKVMWCRSSLDYAGLNNWLTVKK